jgi:hypothetical protein
MNLLIPLITIFYGYTGITMTKLEEGEDDDAVKA